MDEGAPTATITTPTAATTWKVGDAINFSGSATDPQDGTLPAAALSWSVILHHCPSTCHTHLLQNLVGTASGSFTAPDHDYPSYLEIRLTATDSSGLTDTKSVQLDPKTVSLSFASGPSGLQLVVGSSSTATPFARTVIVGSGELGQRAEPGVERNQLRVHIVVRRRRTNPHDRRARNARDVYRDLLRER